MTSEVTVGRGWIFSHALHCIIISLCVTTHRLICEVGCKGQWDPSLLKST